MIAISSLLIYFVTVTRKKLEASMSLNDAKRFKRDLKLTANVIFLILMFFVTQIPYSLLVIVVYYPPPALNIIMYDLYLLFYGLDFFVYISTNSNFRNECKKVLKLKPKRSDRQISKAVTNNTNL